MERCRLLPSERTCDCASSRMDNTEQFDKFRDCSQPFSRIPIGPQLRKPSLIDFVVKDPGEANSPWLDWKDIAGDHA
jgi:hypothetical protein